MNCHYCNGFNCKLWRRTGDYIVAAARLICADCLNRFFGISRQYLETKYNNPQRYCYGLYYNSANVPISELKFDKHKLLVPAILCYDLFCLDNNYPQKLWEEWLKLPLEPTIYYFNLPPLLS